MNIEIKAIMPHAGAHEKIVLLLHRTRKPEYLGTIAVEIGYGLKKTEAYVRYMIDAGELNWLTVREKEAIGARTDAEMVRLVAKPTAAKAHRT